MTTTPDAPDGLFRRAGTTARDGWSLVVTPDDAGWGYTGLRIADLSAGGRIELATGADEAIVLPLSGAVRVTCDGQTLDLAGRTGVFAGPTDFAYVPIGAAVVL